MLTEKIIPTEKDIPIDYTMENKIIGLQIALKWNMNSVENSMKKLGLRNNKKVVMR